MWLVWDPDAGETIDDARTVRGFDASDAAENWAERSDSDSAEYAIVRGSPATVLVRSAADEAAPIEKYEVHGESAPSYNAYLQE